MELSVIFQDSIWLLRSCPGGPSSARSPYPPGRVQEALGKHLASNGNVTKAGGGLELNPSRSTGIHLFTKQTHHCNKCLLRACCHIAPG